MNHERGMKYSFERKQIHIRFQISKSLTIVDFKVYNNLSNNFIHELDIISLIIFYKT